MWQASTSRGFDSSETNQAGTGDINRSRSRDKRELLYLHYHNAYGHKARQDGNLPWVASTDKSHDHILTWSYEIKWQTKIIFTILMPMATKLDKVVIYNKELWSRPKAFWSRGLLRSRKLSDLLCLYHHKAYAHQTWQSGELLGEAAKHKVTQPFEYMVTLGHVIN